MSSTAGTSDPFATTAIEKHKPLLNHLHDVSKLFGGTACADYGSLNNPVLSHAVSDRPCVFRDIFELMHKGCPTKRKADPLKGAYQSDNKRIEPDLETTPLNKAQKKFLLQICSCLMANPTSCPLYCTQYIVSEMGRQMGQSDFKVSVGLRVTLISPSGGEDVLVAKPATHKPCMRNLSDLLYLANATLDLPGGPSEKQLAQLSCSITALLQRPPPFPPWTIPIATSFIGIGYCPIFGGGWVEVRVSASCMHCVYRHARTFLTCAYYTISTHTLHALSTQHPLSTHTRHALSILSTQHPSPHTLYTHYPYYPLNTHSPHTLYTRSSHSALYLHQVAVTAVLSFSLALLSFYNRLANKYENLYFITIGVVATLLPLWFHQHIHPINVMATALSVQVK
jgi:uncharacterized membrane protein YjjP (DUF1212 family)